MIFKNSGTDRLPRNVHMTHATSATTMVVCTASDSFRSSFAPQYCAMTTPAPVAMPMKKPMMALIELPTEPTAASASLLTYCPSTMLLHRVVHLLKMFPIRSGHANRAICFHTLPCVRSISLRLRFIRAVPSDVL